MVVFCSEGVSFSDFRGKGELNVSTVAETKNSQEDLHREYMEYD